MTHPQQQHHNRQTLRGRNDLHFAQQLRRYTERGFVIENLRVELGSHGQSVRVAELHGPHKTHHNHSRLGHLLRRLLHGHA